MAKHKKTAAELRAENRLLRRIQIGQTLASIINNIVRWGGAVLIVRYGYLTVNTLAGETTIADIGISLLTDIRLSNAVAWIFGGSAIYYGLRQRKLSRDTIEHLQGRITQYEKSQDPRRSSSKLTTRGETRKEDTI